MSDQEDEYEDQVQQEEHKFEDSSEEDEDEDNFEEDDFIVDDDGDDMADDDDIGPPLPSNDDMPEIARQKKKKKRRRYREDSPELAEGDLQLLEDEGVRVDRKKKLKRLRKGASDEEDNAPLDDDVRDLAGDEDDDRFAERRREADQPVDYDDDMDDFIDDGGRGRRRRAAEREGLVSSEAVRQARSIFGDIDEVTQYRGAEKLFKDGEEGEEEDDAEYRVDEPKEVQRRPLRTIRDRDTDRFSQVDDNMPEQAPTSQQYDDAIAQELSAPTDNLEEASRIVNTDIPEQLQAHFGPEYKTPSISQIRIEAEWIYRKGFHGNPLYSDLKRFPPLEVTSKIEVLLSYIHIDNLDIPFISLYRKDYIKPFLIRSAGEVFRAHPLIGDRMRDSQVMPIPRGFNSYLFQDFTPGISFDQCRGVPPGYDDGFGDWSVLWFILDLDKKYADMVRFRRKLRAATRTAAEKGVPDAVCEDLRGMVQKSDDETQLKDGERYLRLAVELAEALSNDADEYRDEKPKGPNVRPVRRKSRYTDFCKRGYRDFSSEFGLSARQLGENIKSASQYVGAMQVHVPVEADSEPLVTAGVVARRLDSSIGMPSGPEDKLAERVLVATRYILATEIIADMQVSQAARNVLCKSGTVSISTSPTPQGISHVNDTHPLRSVTSLYEKKLETFRNSIDFALIKRAVEMGYTTMEIVLQSDQVTVMENLLKAAFLTPDGVNSTSISQLWNEQRQLIIIEVMKGLIKQVKEDIEEELVDDTSMFLRERLSNAASRRFLLGPSRPNPLEDGCPRVLAFCVTGEDDEEPDPLQTAKDAEEAKDNPQVSSGRRMSRERLTIVDLDENGEYQNGYELFAGWLRRPMRRNHPESELPMGVKSQLKSIISRSKAHVIIIGIGSGGRRVMRLQSDIMLVLKEMAVAKTEDEVRPNRPLMLSAVEVAALKEPILPGSEIDETEKIRRILSKHVVLCDEFPARVYARTKWADIGLTMDAMTLLEKRAIGLARMAQEPLWVYSAIGQEEEHALHLKCHPYHYFATPGDRMLALQRALFRAVCTTGVDINRLLRLPHTQPMLAYVGGLGIHKGKALIKALENVLGEEDRGLLSRKHLWSQNYVGRKVFLSTAAFLRVRNPELHSGGSTKRAVEIRRSKLGRKSRGRRRDEDVNIFDPMDDSRIHPEHYAIAIKIADEALRDDDGKLRTDITAADEYQESMGMTSAVIDDPSGLARLALDEYAAHLEDRGRGSLYETVKIIASEFQGPFKDYRRALTSPEPKALFYLVTGADPVMVRVGSSLTATSCQLRMRKNLLPDGNNVVGIACQLPDDIRGFIPWREFSDDTDPLSDSDFRQLVPDGSSLGCRIIKFEFLRFEAVLSSKLSLMADPNTILDYVPLVNTNDEAYRPYPKVDNVEANGGRIHREATGDLSGRNRMRKQTNETMSRLRARAKPVVQHSFFRDIPGFQALNLLRSMLPGDIIIRPSQYTKDCIVFSCKFAVDLPGMDSERSMRGVFHKDCHMDHDDDESAPWRLRVDNNMFEHVDQALEQYFRPIISNLTEALDHRKFKAGSEKSLETFISSEKRRCPKSIPYVFGLSERRPTSFVLVYIPGSTSVKREEVSVVPDGYKLRNVLHKNIDVLITWFKNNMRKGTTSAHPPVREAQISSAPVVASPYASVASPYREVRSPYREARSPFMAPASPFPGARSPFTPNLQATPARDVPPPPAPVVQPVTLPVASTMPDPYSYEGSSGRARHDGPPSISEAEWDKATLHKDDPPPSVQNGSFNKGNFRGYGDTRRNEAASPFRVAPRRLSSPGRRVSPRRMGSPRRKLSPHNLGSSRRRASPGHVSPRRLSSPGRKPSPGRKGSPRRRDSPRRMNSPRMPSPHRGPPSQRGFGPSGQGPAPFGQSGPSPFGPAGHGPPSGHGQPPGHGLPGHWPPGNGSLRHGQPGRGPAGPPSRGPQARGPPHRGPQQRAPPRGRGTQDEGNGSMPTWRGQAPIPAWKKQAESKQ